MNAYFDGMRRYASFSGRSTRSQYWLFQLVHVALLIVGLIIDNSIGTANKDGGLVTGLIAVVHLLPSLAVFVRRLHDTDRSGWWFFFGLIPIIGIVVLIVFLCTRSAAGANRFGTTAGTAGYDSRPVVGLGATINTTSLDQLEKLAALKSSGAIDDAEYQHLKSQVAGIKPVATEGKS